jgi:Family of unknown function (DUF6221)
MADPMDLAAWLLEQIAEDERVARAAEPEHPRLWDRFSGEGFDEHIVRWQPRRVLAECDAKRRIIALHRPTQPAYPGDELTYPNAANLCQRCGPGDNWQAEQEPFGEMPCDHLRLLALPYVDRPGYREEWRP